MSKRICLFLTILVLLTGCSTTEKTAARFQQIDPNNLKPVAAEFVTTTTLAGQQPITSTWRIQRNNQRVELVRLDSDISEIWSRTDKNQWFYQKAFSQDQTVVEYSPSDLAALGIQPLWLPIALAIDPKVLESLGTAKSSKPLFGFDTQRFKGKFQDADYDVIWIPELALAARVKYSKNGISSVTEAKQPHDLAQTPWPPQDIKRYRLIDYSDLGDMERDPFVAKVQSHLPGGHAH